MNCNSNTMALITDTSSACSNGCEPKSINVICRQIIIPYGQETLAIEGDTNSSYREFLVPSETEQGYNLENATFTIVVNNSNNEQHEVEITDENKTIVGNYIKLKWVLSVTDTVVPGNLMISIRATENNFKWETYPATFNIKESLVGVPTASTTILLEEKVITPTDEEQIVLPDQGYGALSKVTVEPIPVVFDTAQIRQCYNMFFGNTEIVEAPDMNTSNVTNMQGMFYNCSNLTTIILYDVSKVIDFLNMFSGCSSLSNESLGTIMEMCIDATSYTDTKTLAQLGLTEAQISVCETLDNYETFLNAGWTTGY